METNKEIRTKVHIQAAINSGISFEDLRKAFEDACECLEQAEKDLNDIRLELSTPSTADLQGEPLYKWAALIVCEGHQLRRKLEQAEKQIEQQQECIRELVRQAQSAYDYLCTSSKFDWDNLIKPPLKAAIAKAEERELFNSYASKYMTESGAPE